MHYDDEVQLKIHICLISIKSLSDLMSQQDFHIKITNTYI